MENKIITFDTAKLAKEVGFDFPVLSYYDYVINNIIEPDVEEWSGQVSELMDNHNRYMHFSAPTQSILQSWIRLTHGIAVFPTLDSELNWIYKIVSLKPCSIFEGTIVSKHSYGSDYETCLEEGLFETLNLIKNK